MRHRITALRLVLGALIAAFALPSSADALGFELEARYWFLDFSGSIGTRENPLPPDFDLALEDFGLEADDGLEARFTFRPGLGIFVRGAWTTMEVGASRSEGFDLGGLPIPPVEINLSASVDFDYARLGAGWQFVSPQKALRIGPYVEAKAFQGDGRASFTNSFLPEFDQSIREDFAGAFPAVGALLEVKPMDKLEIFLDASAELFIDEANLVDFEVGLRFYPIDLVGIGGGYRIFKVDGEIDDVLLDVEFDGFFFSVALRF